MIDFGEGVRLSSLSSEHKEKARQWRNDFSTWRWCRQFDLISEIDHEKWYEAQNSNKSIRNYAILDDQCTFVGVCGFTGIDHVNRHAEFSIYIGTGDRGRKLAKPALNTLFHHGFSNLNLNHIFGETFDSNPAAKLFESIGMKHDGIKRKFYFKACEYIDAHIYSVLKDEWAMKAQI